MNIDEYISSGIVESYVLGLADAAERAEFERMCAAYDEVRVARDNFERLLEEQMQVQQLQPPAELKSKIFSAIEMEAQQLPGDAASSTVPMGTSGRASAAGNGRLRTMTATRFVAAAAVILLLCSTALNFYFFNRYRDYNERYQALVISQSELALHNQVLQTRMLEYEKTMEMMNDPRMAVVKMPAIAGGPDPSSATTVFWDTVSKDVYLAVSKLPAPSQDQQYQLWAMVDGKPVDAGVFDMAEDAGVVKMKNIPRAQAFAITLEKKGGSPAPTMDKLYVMGKV